MAEGSIVAVGVGLGVIVTAGVSGGLVDVLELGMETGRGEVLTVGDDSVVCDASLAQAAIKLVNASNNTASSKTLFIILTSCLPCIPAQLKENMKVFFDLPMITTPL